MNNRYLLRPNKRMFKVKKYGLLAIAHLSVAIISIGGNMYLKSNPTFRNLLFWSSGNETSQVVIEANAISASNTLRISNIAPPQTVKIKDEDKTFEDLIKERDELLKRIEAKEAQNKQKLIPTPTPQITKLNKKIRSIAHNLGGVMTGHSTYLYNKCIEYDVNPLLVAAIIKHESGNGTSSAIRNRNNIAGFMGSRGLMRFESIRSSIDFMVVLLKEQYIDKGYDSIASIQKKYCPIGAKNDPTDLNRYWLPMVTQYYNEMVKDCSLYEDQ